MNLSADPAPKLLHACLFLTVDGEIRQLVEVKLNVVHASHALPGPGVLDKKYNDINSLSEDSRCVRHSDPPGDAK